MVLLVVVVELDDAAFADVEEGGRPAAEDDVARAADHRGVPVELALGVPEQEPIAGSARSCSTSPRTVDERPYSD